MRGLRSPLSPEFYEGLEELLVAADLGPGLAARLAGAVQARRPTTLEEARLGLEVELGRLLSPTERALNLTANPTCILLYGINGAGKTTSAGKLAYRLRQEGRNPLLVAADTYRAAGLEQTAVWAQRAGVASFAGRAGGDPAAVVFDALQTAAGHGHDVVLVDTAGRLQTQQNLLQELAKIGRVAGRALPGAPHESLLVLDGTLGQASLGQALGFHQAIPLSGLILAKMDGTAKGGAVVAVEAGLGVPTKLIGVGEGIDDLAPFEPSAFAASLFGEGP
jgi:fused signal recognition particle receptor